jgi:hypothetical protein
MRNTARHIILTVPILIFLGCGPGSGGTRATEPEPDTSPNCPSSCEIDLAECMLDATNHRQAMKCVEAYYECTDGVLPKGDDDDDDDNDPDWWVVD